MKNKTYTLEEVKKITEWYNIVSFRKTKEGFWEVTDGIGYKKIYSKDLKKELTEWFKEDYIIKDKKIFVEIGKTSIWNKYCKTQDE